VRKKCSTGKIIYPTQKAANKAKRALKRKRGWVVYIYPCKRCNKYHLSSQPNRYDLYKGVKK